METTITLSVRSLHYYVTVRHWISDLEFFKVETSFFHRLLDDYFILLADPVHIEKLKQFSNKLFKLEKDESYATKLVNKQLTQLELISENTILENEEELGIKQVQLEKLMSKLKHEYQAVKKQLFALILAIIKGSTKTNNKLTAAPQT